MAADDSYTAADERARARRAGIQAKKDEQPANTTRSYAAKQREWKAWCHTPRAAADGSLYSWPDGELVTPDKLAAWLKEDILLRRVVPPQKKKPRARAAELLADDREGYVPPTGLATAAVDLTEGSLLTRGTIDAYIAAVIELWRLQVAHGNANTENPGRRRRLPPDEWLRIQDLLLTGAAYTPQNLRTRVDLLFGHYYLLRGENRRKMELADLSLLDYPPSEGPTPCGCLVSLLRDGKLNKTARKEFMGALRHKDPYSVRKGPSTALLWRWHVAGEPPRPSGAVRTGIGSRSSSGGTASRSSYPTQLQETWRIFGAAGLIASKKTHLPRRVGAQDAETHGTSLAQISQAGRWNQSVLCQAYLTHLPRQFMRIVAGFSASRGLLARAAHEPPYVLQKQLWPWIEEWEPRFEARARRQCWAEGGLDDDDLAADGFLKLMRRLRIVLLQDLAVLQLRYPSLPFFAYALWRARVGRVRRRRAVHRGRGYGAESTREALLQNSQRLAIRLEARLDGIQGGLDALLQGKVPITFTGYFGAGVQFCRRKVIWDELLARMASGKCKEAAVAELELLRAGRSLNRLVDELKQRRRRGQDRGQGQGQIRVQLEVRAVGAEDPDGKADRPRRRKPAAS
ncbi:centromere DNA-binding protein complex CBF3 subunit [Hirsutella rhossiliensis]|uniref:Centromere DNA-binding protein complex CBF3 subunit n=1 Tax=Hirsutella rhossiliensis TaxID=111463 RepID=A0A9P8SDE7_9HYPO|nr:centromere DNA-binding protein complex CBF3 subunit [Hirsutella rhossiliensis]KAH0957260.1 centromere DNA-binding protein complex CBF3 subunit [Hirsutella rhossiliensis]